MLKNLKWKQYSDKLKATNEIEERVEKKIEEKKIEEEKIEEDDNYQYWYYVCYIGSDLLTRKFVIEEFSQKFKNPLFTFRCDESGVLKSFFFMRTSWEPLEKIQTSLTI